MRHFTFFTCNILFVEVSIVSDSLNQKIMRIFVCVKVNIRKELTLQLKRSTSWTISTFNPTFTDKIVQAEPNLRNEKKINILCPSLNTGISFVTN